MSLNPDSGGFENWEATRCLLEKAKAINPIRNFQDEFGQSTSPIRRVLQISLRVSGNDLIRGWAFLNSAQNCIIVYFRKKVSDNSNFKITLSVWNKILIFKENPWIEEITVLSEEPKIFDFEHNQIMPVTVDS